MMTKRLILVSACTLAVAACSSDPKLENAQYWQRSSATSALYLEGPKAQQGLHENIASCTHEINELVRLGAIRRAIPADTVNGQVPDPSTPSGRMAGWESPQRDGYLYAQHSDYHDFETCMGSKGWERVEYLPYTTADRARKDYIENMSQDKKKSTRTREYVTSVHTSAQNPPPYKNLNE